MNDEGEGWGWGLVLAIWRFFVVGWLVYLLACLLAWCGIRKQGSFLLDCLCFCLCLCLALLLVLLGESFGSRGKKGESASSEIVLAPLECLTIYTLHLAGER